jgi:hypothetical protein
VVESVCSPFAVATRVNGFLKKFAARSESFDHLFSATLFFGIVEQMSLEMHYFNAGHPAPLVRRGAHLIPLEATAPRSGTSILRYQRNRAAVAEDAGEYHDHRDGEAPVPRGTGARRPQLIESLDALARDAPLSLDSFKVTCRHVAR